MFYSNKIKLLSDLFGNNDLELEENSLSVSGKMYPIVDDVIILLPYEHIPESVKNHINSDSYVEIQKETSPISQDIQYSFGEEWKQYNKILPEHESEFKQYFDIVNLDDLKGKRVCDLGSGIGRWSYFLRDKVDELVLIDFSESIFEARKNLSSSDNAVFFMADILNLPFKDNSFDFIYSLGVLHHIDEPVLDSVRKLSILSDQFLVYLYYSLDNRGLLYKSMFSIVNVIRKIVCSIKNTHGRNIITEMLMWSCYFPFILLGNVMSKFSLNTGRLPIYSFYGGMSYKRIRQDVYDRFFTSIEQRVSKNEIKELKDTFSNILISEQQPLWHALLTK